MLELIKERCLSLWRELTSQKPHFSFITAHYVWIVGATFLSSVLIYGPGKGNVSYINALVFAAGANTQAGLNPVNINALNTFQQFIIYIFPMLSNPITLNGSVVILRLYWFEKKFQGWVKDARQRRGTLSMSKSMARDEAHRSDKGVNGRAISIVPRIGRGPRITNDGVLLDKDDERTDGLPKPMNGNAEKTADYLHDHPRDNFDHMDQPRKIIKDGDDEKEEEEKEQGDGPFSSPPKSPSNLSAPARGHNRSGSHTAITFADTVKRSDGLDDDHVKLPEPRSNAEHIAILRRQREEDDEVLRIPGPRDAERGLGPRTLYNGEAQEEDDAPMARVVTHDSRPTVDSRTLQDRQPTITIAEPEHHKRDDLATEAKTIGSTFDSLRFRRPRIFNRNQQRVHEDDDEPNNTDNGRTHRLHPINTIRSVLSREKTYDDMPYLSYNPTIGRNSNFIGLSLEQREELGGIEYRSLRTLALVLLFYFWGFQLFGLACLLPFIIYNGHYRNIVQEDGISKTWWGFFTPNSAFTDLGFTLTPDSMNSFHTSSFVMVIMAFLVLIGNTGFPVMLRFVIWVMSKIVPVGSGLWEELKFLLDHPRRCFTLLFPSAANWWLFWILILLNTIDLVFFIILDLGNGPVSKFPVHIRIADGLFQAASTRTAGFSCVNISQLHPAVTVSYIIMMYISVFPIAISIRRTNVYEEKSLGVYNVKEQEDDSEESAVSYVGTHLRRQLSFDLWYVFLGLFILAISEGPKLQRGDFGLFEVLFEIVSAYGTVGMSFGWSGGDESLVSQFTTVGKLVIVAMEIRGRHRGLPYGLDRAVLLPSESRFESEAQQTAAAMARTDTVGTTATATGVLSRNNSISRGRRRSISRERVRTNSNLVTQFLHPGPMISHQTRLGHKRAKSADYGGYSLQHEVSQPQMKSEEDDIESVGPLPSITRPTSRRTYTTMTT